MVKKEVLRKAQLIMLKELIELDKVCQKNEIKYWIDAGTLLGAIRHKGFIPWDDDVDICMLKEDYIKFLNIYKKKLEKQFFLQTEETDLEYKNFYKNSKYSGISPLIIKLRDRDSVFIEEEQVCDRKFHQGINIDIFIMDKFNCRFTKMYKLCSIIAGIRVSNYKNKYLTLKKIILNLKLNILAKNILNLLKEKRKDSFFVGYEHYYTFLYKYEDIFPLSKIEFEGYKFPCPNNFDAYLKELYGNTYMKLPSEKNRMWHAKEIRLNEKCFFEKELERTGRKLYEDE